MKEFFYKLFIFIILLILIDIVGGNILEKYYFQAKGGGIQRIVYSAEHTNEEVLIFGSSRASSHYVPDIIEDSLGLSCYNVGLAACGILTYYAILLKIEERYFPKVIVLDLKPQDYLISHGDRFDNLITFAPFYGENETLDSLFVLYSKTENIKMKSTLYRYNSRFAEILAANIASKRTHEKGYVSLHGIISCKELLPDKKIDADIDTIKVQYINRFIEKALLHNSTIILAISPAYFSFDQKVFELFSKTVNKYKIPLLYHYSDTAFITNSGLFNDPDHLNDKGARKYSASIAKEIKSILLQSK